MYEKPTHPGRVSGGSADIFKKTNAERMHSSVSVASRRRRGRAAAKVIKQRVTTSAIKIREAPSSDHMKTLVSSRKCKRHLRGMRSQYSAAMTQARPTI